MIKNFENITQELNDDEMNLVPMVIKGFEKYTINNPIKSDVIVKKINDYFKTHKIKMKMTGARLRKIVNYIRTNSLQPLMATSKGYFVSNDINVIMDQIQSLNQRAKSIRDCAHGLELLIKNKQK